jgi:hypothetical protein
MGYSRYARTTFLKFHYFKNRHLDRRRRFCRRSGEIPRISSLQLLLFVFVVIP